MSFGRHLIAVGLIAIPLCSYAQTQELTWEYSVQVSAAIRTNPSALFFSWPQDVATVPEFYTVSRKAPSDQAWGPPTLLPGSSTNYLDTNITVGIAYEYQFYKYTTNHVGYGYICAGIEIPLIENRGRVILLVDQTFASPLNNELLRLNQDLVGDGWTVSRHNVDSNASVSEIKALVKADYDADPANVKALFLLGRVPVPYSGDTAPDGHFLEHSGAWAADTFYGDMTGVWTDTSVDDVSSSNPHNHNIPGDGKFDQSEIPGIVQLQIGRVDFDDMPGLDTNGLPTFPSEGELLRRYLNKDHNYRHKLTSLPPRGLVYNYTGDRGGEAFAADAWRNYAPLLGPPPATPLGPDVFLPILQATGYQWAYATCGSGPSVMWNLGGTYWIPYATESGSSLDFVQMDIKTQFVMLLGSWIGDWDMQDNLMRAVLATPTYGLISVYAGRPHWYFHYLGIGETFGYCARLTQNNHADGLYRNQSNNFAGFVHTALLGDPTLRLHTVAPPSGLQLARSISGAQLSWSPSPDQVLGYYLYHAPSPEGPFLRVTPGLVKTVTFVDRSNPDGQGTYMVRAVALQTSASGSYYNASEGAYAGEGFAPALRVFGTSENLGLAWPSLPGWIYRVLWSPSLNGTNWLPISEDLVATGTSIICSNILDANLLGTGWLPGTNGSADTVWIDDALPAGGIPGADSEPWTWISSNPVPLSGSFALQSSSSSNFHQQYFSSATSTLTIGTQDVLFAYVYLDPANLPAEIMLQWNDGTSWEHRAFWGADLIPYGATGTPGQLYEGPLPPAGSWQALRVPARDVGLAGSTVSGMAFSLYDGRATWDRAGTHSPPAITRPAPNLPACFFKIVGFH